MPWRTTSAVEERLRFVAEYLDGVATMTELAEEYGISRETGYTWVRRYEAEGPAGLHDRSRRPHRSANATPQAVIDALVEARRHHPTWGPKKLLTYGWPLTTRPARSTASAILKRAGLIDRRRRRRRPGHPGRPPAVIASPNVLWTIDFKGQFRTGDRRWCYPLTLIDSCSRYVLACDGLRSTQTATTRAVLERAFREYGLPERIRSDNGVPFAAAWAAARISMLSVWWVRLGIIPELIEPGRPAQNGRHERFHRTLKRETAQPPATTLRTQQQRFDEFRVEFNTQRPHEALGQLPPSAVYAASSRSYPHRLPPLVYPSDSSIRRVDEAGCVRWAPGVRVYISRVLTGQDVAFRPIADGMWGVYFGPLVLGHYDERRGPTHNLAPVTRGRSPANAGSRPPSTTQ